MNYFTNEQTFEQYYTNNCQTLTSLRMNTQEITTYVTNPTITIRAPNESSRVESRVKNLNFKVLFIKLEYN